MPKRNSEERKTILILRRDEQRARQSSYWNYPGRSGDLAEMRKKAAITPKKLRRASG